MLHVVAICSNNFKNAEFDDHLKPLAEPLDAQLWGLLPGFHRLAFDDGHVLLTLCIGDVHTLLRQQRFVADSVYLNQPSRTANDALHTIKASARLCRRGTVFTATQPDAHMQSALRQCGFESSGPTALQYVFNPAWQSKKSPLEVHPTTCVVIGAGLAGAAVASSMARRGWAVTVLDAAATPASGASSLPAGLLVSHTSPDDSLLSRLSRSGVRMTLQQARTVLRHGMDWGHTGVLQRSFEATTSSTPTAWSHQPLLAARDWCYPASNQTLAAAGLLPGTAAVWHAAAGWVQPAALVNAWLATPGVTWRGSAEVAQLEQTSNGWCVMDAAGHLLHEANIIVLCAGHASQPLAKVAGGAPPDLQAVRGQVTFGLQLDSGGLAPLPPFPVNGDGGLISNIATPNGPLWLMGASYERDTAAAELKPQDHIENLARLQKLLPPVADALADQFKGDAALGWAGIRCATPNRLPLVAPLAGSDGVWLCTGMGSRGLSFAALCGELLAAQLHQEPLPITQKMADALRRPAAKIL